MLFSECEDRKKDKKEHDMECCRAPFDSLSPNEGGTHDMMGDVNYWVDKCLECLHSI
jgi:formylglycine-generating enzyme required for sulfatase activity